MKRQFITFIIVSFLHTILSANSNYELKLYEQVVPLIFKKTPIKVFVDENAKQLLEQSDKFELVSNCSEDTMVIIGQDFVSLNSICKDKPVFATSYPEFKNNQNSFGAFYWRKGRPQLIFNKTIIDKYNLKLPSSLTRYIK